jgi:hypothetical protein
MAKMTPYTVYLPEEHYEKIRSYAKTRQASSVVRDAICSFLDGNTQFVSGYNKALKDAIKKLKAHPELKNISIGNETVSNKACKILQEMEK